MDFNLDLDLDLDLDLANPIRPIPLHVAPSFERRSPLPDSRPGAGLSPGQSSMEFRDRNYLECSCIRP